LEHKTTSRRTGLSAITEFLVCFVMILTGFLFSETVHKWFSFRYC